jgi:tetratricopeptide (TPR) repeat protein
MSLINDMLKDLEKRPRPVVNHGNIFHGIGTNVYSDFRRNKNYYYIIAGLLFFLLVVSVVIISKKSLQHHAQQIHAQQVSQVSTQAAPAEKIPAIAPTAGMLTGIAMQMQQDMTYLRFMLNQNTLYHIDSNVNHNQLAIIFENTHLLAAIPKIDYAGSGIENIQAFTDENGDLKLLLSMNPNVDVKRLELKEEGKAPELQLDLSYKNDDSVALQTSPTLKISPPGANVGAAAPTIPVTIKKPVAANYAEQEYAKARVLIESGRDTDAINVLTNILIQFPQYNQAREALAKLMLSNGLHMEAKKLINEGLALQPDYLPFVELKARLLMDEGKLKEAISLLEKSAPPLAENEEYHAFIAALYQRQGQSGLAANLYKQLATLQPTNGKWWLGLGVALESMGNHDQAQEAYANADNSAGLTPELKAYLATQLHA